MKKGSRPVSEPVCEPVPLFGASEHLKKGGRKEEDHADEDDDYEDGDYDDYSYEEVEAAEEGFHVEAEECSDVVLPHRMPYLASLSSMLGSW